MVTAAANFKKILIKKLRSLRMVARLGNPFNIQVLPENILYHMINLLPFYFKGKVSTVQSNCIK